MTELSVQLKTLLKLDLKAGERRRSEKARSRLWLEEIVPCACLSRTEKVAVP